MRRPLALLAVALTVAVETQISAGAGPPPAPVRGCASRVEGTGPPRSFAQPGDVVIGPVAFLGLQHLADPAELAQFRSGNLYLVKSPVGVRAGRRVTAVIGPSARDRVSLSFAARSPQSVADGNWAVTFQACRWSTRAFSYPGSVGLKTSFNGGFILAEPGCVPLQVWVRGRAAPLRRTISFGAGDCAGPAA